MARGRRQQPGDIVRIDIGDGKQCFALALTPPLYAFFEGICAGGELLQDVRADRLSSSCG